MKTGLLWFDDDPRKALEEKVQRAATYYEGKYGQSPTLCFVHPSIFNNWKEPESEKMSASEVEIRAGHSILPDHLWLGMAESIGPGTMSL